MADESRYAKDWNQYSRDWETRYGAKHRNLGDEWNDEDGALRQRDDYYFTILADRFLRPDATVLEVGPGGGKWSVRLARRVKKLICLDVAEEMLARTRQRCADQGLTNVEFLLGNGKDFQPVATESINFIFSFDVFVHIALEDTFPYVQEMNRVLVPGGQGTCHHAIASAPQSFNRIEVMNDWYRSGNNTLGQFFYYSPETLRRMYEHCGMQVHEMYIEDWHCTCMFTRPQGSPVPKLEELLRQLISPAGQDPGRRAEIIEALKMLPAELESALRSAFEKAHNADDIWKRAEAAADIRRIWRGLSTKGRA